MAEENPVQHLLSQLLVTQLPTPVSFITKQIATIATSVFQFTLPFISAVLHTREGPSSGVSPDLLNAALLLFILWISLQIMGMASRYMYSMVMAMIKFAMFIAFTVVGFSIANRGLVATQHDIMVFLESIGNRALDEQWDRLNQAHGTSHSARARAGNRRL